MPISLLIRYFGKNMPAAYLLLTTTAFAASTNYDDLIIRARAGDRQPVLDYLQAQQHSGALTPAQLADWLQITGWAGRDDEVIRIYETAGGNLQLPARATAAVARAYRNTKAWQPSLSAWRAALAQEPGNSDLRAGWIMTLADSGQSGVALSEATAFTQQHSSPLAWQTLAYVQLRGKKSADALATLAHMPQSAADTQAQNAAEREAYLANRLFSPADDSARRAGLSPQQQAAYEANVAAQLVRLAFMPSRNEQEQFLVADKAIDYCDRLIARLNAGPQTQPLAQRVRMDRVGALLARQRYREVITEYEALAQQRQALPAYVRSWAVSAYLAQQQPDNAWALMNAAPVLSPPPAALSLENSDAFYASLESGDAPAALRLVKRYIARSPWQRRVYGSPVPAPNEEWLQAYSLYLQYLKYTGDLPAAQKLAEHMARTAPGNQSTGIALADVLQARGLTHEAEWELKRVEGIEPGNLELERQQAWNALGLQTWRQAWLLAADVEARSPGQPASLRLRRAMQIRDMSELRVSSDIGLYSDTPISGSQNRAIRSTLYSPPLDENWRLFGGGAWASSEFTEGKGLNQDLYGGVEWTARDALIEAEIASRHYHAGSGTGLRLTAWNDLGDRWRIGGQLSRLGDDTPLRALRAGITANSATGWVRWRQNESRQYQLRATATRFSDDNQRIQYALSGEERLYTHPRFTLSVAPSLDMSRNSQTTGPYYSPRRDTALSATFNLDHTLYTRGTTRWSQQVALGSGAYWQSGYQTSPITIAGYGQRIDWNDVLDTGFMVSADNRAYDGKRESNVSLSLDLNYRF